MRADIVFIRTNSPNMNPVHNIVNNIVLSASDADVAITMADGRILFENGEYKTIDVERTIWEAGRAAREIKDRL